MEKLLGVMLTVALDGYPSRGSIIALLVAD